MVTHPDGGKQITLHLEWLNVNRTTAEVLNGFTVSLALKANQQWFQQTWEGPQRMHKKLKDHSITLSLKNVWGVQLHCSWGSTEIEQHLLAESVSSEFERGEKRSLISVLLLEKWSFYTLCISVSRRGLTILKGKSPSLANSSGCLRKICKYWTLPQ